MRLDYNIPKQMQAEALEVIDKADLGRSFPWGICQLNHEKGCCGWLGYAGTLRSSEDEGVLIT